MLGTLFSPWPSFTEQEAESIRRVLLSNKVNYWTGTECREFEKEFASWCGTKYAIALANGTVALDLALKALDIGPGDEVIVTPRSFIASVSCVVNAGAIPVFADVDRETGNLSAQTIERVITSNTKAVICVHLAGWPCDMDPIMALANNRGLKVIEDCAQAHGAIYKGKSVGSIGHIGAWSFCQDKIMTTGGEGGMVTTNREDLWRQMWAYKDHGKDFAVVYERDHPPGLRWLHESFGTNWRMIEMQAVIGRSQLRRMPEWTAKRTANAAALREALLPFAAKNGVARMLKHSCEECPSSDCGTRSGGLTCHHAYYKYYTFIRPENLASGWSRDRIISEINARGVPCYVGSCSEIYLEKAFDNTGWRPSKRLAIARELGETSLMFLVHPTLTMAEISRTQEIITEVFGAAGR